MRARAVLAPALVCVGASLLGPFIGLHSTAMALGLVAVATIGSAWLSVREPSPKDCVAAQPIVQSSA